MCGQCADSKRYRIKFVIEALLRGERDEARDHGGNRFLVRGAVPGYRELHLLRGVFGNREPGLSTRRKRSTTRFSNTKSASFIVRAPKQGFDSGAFRSMGGDSLFDGLMYCR